MILSMPRQVLLSISIVFLALSASYGQVPSSDSVDKVKADRQIETLIKDFFADWKKGTITEGQSHFFDAQTPVMLFRLDVNKAQYSKIFQQPAGEAIRRWTESPPKHLELDSLSLNRLTDSLVIANASYTGSGVKGQAAFTLIQSGQEWTIVSLVLKTKFNW